MTTRLDNYVAFGDHCTQVVRELGSPFTVARGRSGLVATNMVSAVLELDEQTLRYWPWTYGRIYKAFIGSLPLSLLEAEYYGWTRLSYEVLINSASQLVVDPTTRRAIYHNERSWNGVDYDSYPACCQLVHPQVVGGRLIVSAVFRSQDVRLVPVDLLYLANLTSHLYTLVETDGATVTMFATNLHCYTDGGESDGGREQPAKVAA